MQKPDQLTDRARKDEEHKYKYCGNCLAFQLAGSGYYSFIGKIIMEMEHETSARKRKSMRQQIDWALKNLKELDDLKLYIQEKLKEAEPCPEK